jgi:O-antigen ligase
MVSIGYSPNIFFNLESSPLKLLDDILSGRYASALFGISFFMQSFNENIYHAVIGFGNEWSNFLYKKYYMQMIGVTFPTIDLSYFQQGDYYSPHNSFVDILISNGLIGFLLFVSIIMFILLTLRNMIENNNLSLVKKYLMLAILVIIVGFFCTDNDFLGGRIILNTFFILFVTSVLVNKHNLPARITG